MTQNNKLQVEAICHGTVIDHIPTQIGMKLFSLFKLTAINEQITIGLNLPSNQQGKKDLIKLENVFLTEEQLIQLTIYAPCATINHIDNYNVVRKQTPPLTKRIDGVLICQNNNCISHSEPVTPSFTVKVRNHQVYLQCKFCEKEFQNCAIL
ncbi:MAG: aspartate carbamoyltransferase, PyrI subunit [Sodalis sp. Psp]|nr:aspartate carbamoyltransferase, PyrI subunit [Sodalis sp. Psp]MCR3756797.1 aspartate carbamoyltransferase, PyrI subunit [Sodalis sp. Ppy]